jgi:hypothetical protein
LNNGPPDIVQDKGGSIHNIKVMIESLQSMVCVIMQESFDTLGIVSLKAKIKIFLILFETFDKELQIQANVDDGLIRVNVDDDASGGDSVDSNADEPVKKKIAKSK